SVVRSITTLEAGTRVGTACAGPDCKAHNAPSGWRMSKSSRSSKHAASRRGSRGRKWMGMTLIAVGGLLALGVNAMRPKPAPFTSPSAMAAPAAAMFLPTVENTNRPQEIAPQGMAWIPGGEFSMGAGDPMGVDHNDVGMHATDDSRPIHRTY